MIGTSLGPRLLYIAPSLTWRVISSRVSWSDQRHLNPALVSSTRPRLALNQRVGSDDRGAVCGCRPGPLRSSVSPRVRASAFQLCLSIMPALGEPRCGRGRAAEVRARFLVMRGNEHEEH
jgi:hypothetical protein